MGKVVGYLIPEYPGQTHIFFWREINALKDLGISVEVVSTRRPPQNIICHSWSKTAQEETSYLVPLTFGKVAGAVATLTTTGLKAWKKCLSALFKADTTGIKSRLRLMAMLFMGAELAALAKRRSWRHLHVHSCGDSANIALFAHLLSGLPYSLTLHGLISGYGSNQRQKWNNARFAVTITRKLLEDAKTLLNETLPDKLYVAPMGVDVKRFKRSNEYNCWQPGELLKLFTCGRLNFWKGHQELIQAVKLMVDKGIDVRLRIAGEDEKGGGGYHMELASLIEEFELSDRVTLLGAIPEDAVRKELEQAHFFVLASHEEALGVATMEAMAMEVPAIATRVGGVPELVNHGEDGWLVEPHKPQELVDAIIELTKNHALTMKLSHNGRETVKQKFHAGLSAEVIARGAGLLPASPATG